MAETRIKNLPSIAPEQISDDVYLGTDNLESLKITFSQLKAYILNNLMALSVGLDVSEFNKNLDSAINTVQELADWVDQADLGGGGGSGDILSTLAIANQLEKQGIKTAIPNGDVMIESFTEIEGEIELYSDYTGGTQIVLKNKIGLMTGHTTPFIIQDSTGNNEVVLISSFVSGSSGAWTYNIAAALASNYTTANSAKIKNYFGSVSGNQLTAASGGTFSQFVKTLLLRQAKDGGTLKVGLDFLGDIFPADVSLLSTNVLKFASATDVKGNFKDKDYVMIFKKTPDEDADTIVLSKQNPQGTGAYSWFIVQLSADSSYSSPDITAAFDTVLDPVTGTFSAGFPNIGADETNYFVIRFSPFLKYLAGNKTATTFTQAVPSEVIVKSDEIPYTSVPYIHSHWKMNELSGNAINSRQSSGAFDLTQVGTVPSTSGKLGRARGTFNTSNYFVWNSSGSSTTVYDSAVFVVDGWIKMQSVPGGNQHIISKGTPANGGSGWAIYISNEGRLVFQIIGANVSPVTNIATNQWVHFLCALRATSGVNNWVVYLNGSLEATASGTTKTVATSNLVIGGDANSFFTLDLGILDSLTYWSSVPSTTEELGQMAAQRYAQGRGREYGNDAGYTLKYNIPLTGTINKVALIGGTSVQTAGLSDSILSCNAAVV